MADRIRIEILRDGTAKFTTGTVSDANHSTAEDIFATIAALLGGEVTRTPSEEHEHHLHQHEHGHEHHHG